MTPFFLPVHIISGPEGRKVMTRHYAARSFAVDKQQDSLDQIQEQGERK